MEPRIEKIISEATVKEKVSLLSGLDAWHTVSLSRFDLPSITMSDGPYGLRKVMNNASGLEVSYPATAFPTSSLIAASWDEKLISKMAKAMALEAQDQGVDVILGPGLNIKRSPLCGRNFEYFSEDPLLSGKLASAFIKGMQAEGVGATAKHFLANSQETKRLLNNAIIDERTLREIYLRAFEIAIKEGKPFCVMSSYNMVNGDYMSENKEIVDDILRQEWGYRGVVMTDWGAMHNPVSGVRAGTDLAMPGRNEPDKAVIKAVNSFDLDIQHVNQSVIRIANLALKLQENRQSPIAKVDYDEHFAIARDIASNSMILLKNDNDILPLDKNDKVLVIGAFAENSRFQGAGSSQINPYKLDNLLLALKDEGMAYDYFPGFSIDGNKETDKTLFSEAIEAAKTSKQVVIMAGLPPAYEAEGADREYLRLPDNQNKLIEALVAINKNIVVVISAGAPVAMPWASEVKAILMAYLAGEASGQATRDVLFGKVNPSGHLAETFPLMRDDTPSLQYFAGVNRNIEYRESIFVGYRYYDTAKRDVLFPFGHGLSYTKFAYDNLAIEGDNLALKGKINISFQLTNIGDRKGKEVVQLYGSRVSFSKLFRSQRQLIAFKKIELAPKESAIVKFSVEANDFRYWNTIIHNWAVEGGRYAIEIGSSSRDIRLKHEFTVEDDGNEVMDYQTLAPTYYNLKSDGHFETHFREFEAIYGRRIYHVYSATHRPFTLDSTIDDAHGYLIGKLAKKIIVKVAKKTAGDDEIKAKMYVLSVLDTPIGSLSALSGGAFSYTQSLGLLDVINGRLIRGFFRLLKSSRKKDK